MRSQRRRGCRRAAVPCRRRRTLLRSRCPLSTAFEHGELVHDPAAAGADHESPGGQRRQPQRREQPAGLVAERDQVDQHVARSDQLVEITVRRPVLLGRRPTGSRPVRHGAAHRAERGHESVSDRAETDDPDASPADLDRPARDDGHLRPPTGAHLAFHPCQVAGHAEQRTEHPLGDGDRIEAGGVGQRDPGCVERGAVVSRHADRRLLDEGEMGGAGDVRRGQTGGTGTEVVDQQLRVRQRRTHCRIVAGIGCDDGERKVAERLAGHLGRQGSQRHQVPRRIGHGGHAARHLGRPPHPPRQTASPVFPTSHPALLSCWPRVTSGPRPTQGEAHGSCSDTR